MKYYHIDVINHRKTCLSDQEENRCNFQPCSGPKVSELWCQFQTLHLCYIQLCLSVGSLSLCVVRAKVQSIFLCQCIKFFSKNSLLLTQLKMEIKKYQKL